MHGVSFELFFVLYFAWQQPGSFLQYNKTVRYGVVEHYAQLGFMCILHLILGAILSPFPSFDLGDEAFLHVQKLKSAGFDSGGAGEEKRCRVKTSPRLNSTQPGE